MATCGLGSTLWAVSTKLEALLRQVVEQGGPLGVADRVVHPRAELKIPAPRWIRSVAGTLGGPYDPAPWAPGREQGRARGPARTVAGGWSAGPPSWRRSTRSW